VTGKRSAPSTMSHMRSQESSLALNADLVPAIEFLMQVCNFFLPQLLFFLKFLNKSHLCVYSKKQILFAMWYLVNYTQM